MTGAIDLLVNPNMSVYADNKAVTDVGSFYFRSSDIVQDIAMEELLEVMTSAGVDHAAIVIDPEDPKDWLLEFSRTCPDRFSLAPQINIDHGMEAVWALRDLAANEKVVMARVMPSMFAKPASHSHYYPLYAKCAELGIAIGVFSGIPGPRFDAASQDPIHLDQVCRDFPMLKIIMVHGADPWWDVAIRLMLKYPNLYLMTSAWLPRYLPASLIHYMNTRGSHKIMWASDHPVLNMKRCLDDVASLDLRPGVRDLYIGGNARAVLDL